MYNGPLSKHRFQVWNKNQHPYRHTMSDFAYSNEAMPGVNNPQQAMDWLVAVLYPLSQTTVATPADLPLGGNVLAVDTSTDTFTAAAHGYKDTDMVKIASTGTLPAPLVAGQTYFVINSTANTFQLALTSDPLETPIDITTAGTGSVTVENVAASYRVVLDDGDGKAAAYRWQQLPSDPAPKWYKVYDMDWSQDSILAAFQNVTQDLYVYQKGKQDLDENGDPLTGVDAGQNVYGSSATGENLNLYANIIDPATGFIQFGSQVAPKVHNVVNLGETARRFVNLYLAGVLTVGNTVYGDGNIDAASGTVDFNDNNITTTGNVTGNAATFTSGQVGQLNFATNTITSDTNIISMLNQTLQNLVELLSAKVTVTDGTNTLELTTSALFALYDSSVGVHNFNNQDVEGIDTLTAGTVNITTANLGNFVISGNTIQNGNAVTFTMPSGATFSAALSAASVTATGQSSGATGVFGNYSFDSTDATTVGANTDFNLNANGTGVVVLKKLIKPITDATISLGLAALRFTTLFLSGGLSDGTDSISISQLLSFRNANTGANDGDALFYDSATGRWLPSNPDAEIDHATLNGLTTGDAGHTQFAMLAGRTGGQSLSGGTSATETLTLQGNAADATNGDVIFASKFRPSGDNTKDIGDATHRVKDLYGAGQNIGLRDENTTTNNNYGATSIGRKYFETTSSQGYTDAGTFSKYPMYTDVVTNSTLTGADQTVPFTLQNVVRFTNASLTSIANISTQADIQGNRFKVLVNGTGAVLTIRNNANISTGSGADLGIDNGGSVIAFYDGTAWRLTSGSGSGSSSSGVNYITNGLANNGTVGWATYADAAGTRPVDGTGGSPNVTWTTTTSSPLRGTNSFLFTKDAANRQGQGAAYAFTIDNADLGKVLKISGDMVVSSGTFAAGTSSTDSDLIFYIYDVTNGVLIEPSRFKFFSNSSSVPEYFQAEFQTPTNSTSFRLIFHCASTSASAYTLKFDNIAVSPNQYVYGTPKNDTVAFTGTFAAGFGTVANNNVKQHRDGDYLVLSGTFDTGTVAGSAPIINLGYTIDTAKINSTAFKHSFGRGWRHIGSGSTTSLTSGSSSDIDYVFTYNGTATQIQIVRATGSATNGGTFVNENTNTLMSNSQTVVLEDVRIPILGFSSSVQMSDSADTRVVAAAYVVTTGASTTANTPLNFETRLYDTHNAVTTGVGVWKFTAPTSGYYRASGSFQTAGNPNIRIWKNGSAQNYLASAATGLMSAYSGSVFLNTGEYLDLRLDSTQTPQSGTLGTYSTTVFIERVTGPSQIAASELIACRYYGTTGTTVTTSAAAVVFNNRDFDTHGIYNSTTGVATIYTAGKYEIGCTVSFTLNSTVNSGVYISLYKNGALYSRLDMKTAPVASTNFNVMLIGRDSLNLIATDTIEVRIQRDTNTAANAVDTTTTFSNISIKRLGL